jgi:hypothetical protein
MRAEDDRASRTEDPRPGGAKAGDHRSMGEALIILGPLALVGYLVARSANPVELASVTTAASGLLVAVARAVSTMRRRK